MNQMRNKEPICVVFDLDDTLYKEIEFVKSGFKYIANHVGLEGVVDSEVLYNDMLTTYLNGGNAFELVDLPLEIKLNWYRYHQPEIVCDKRVEGVFDSLVGDGVGIGILTDGRSITQRNKVKALGLDRYVSEERIWISEEHGFEKPSERGYKYFEELFPGRRYVYVGDNVAKDFIAPKRLGWHTVGIVDNGENIHKQNLELATGPAAWINEIGELINVV